MPISHWGAAVWDRRRVRGPSQAAIQNVVGPIDACNPNFASCPSRTTSGDDRWVDGSYPRVLAWRVSTGRVQLSEQNR